MKLQALDTLAMALAGQYGITKGPVLRAQWDAKDEDERKVWRASAKLTLKRLRALGGDVTPKKGSK